MKTKISTLGKALDRNEQKEVNGGTGEIGLRRVNCLVPNTLTECARYSTECIQVFCWYNPA
jgi:hypothetical protein